jgi:hypothetical protein
MATFRLLGPFAFDFATGGLQPGETVPTVWTIEPPPGRGTVTLTAVPVGSQPGDIDGPEGVSLAVRDPTVQVQAAFGGLRFTLHAVVANVGQNPAFKANMFISCVEP